MKQLLIICVLLNSFFSFSQIKIDCFDNVYYKSDNNILTIFINGKEIQTKQPKELLYDGIEIKCINNYLGISYNFNDGIANNLVINIFKFDGNNFYLENILKRYSTKREDSWTIASCNKTKLENFKIDLDQFIISGKCKDEKSISSISGYQEGNEVEEIPYYNLIVKTFKKNKFSDIKLFTNEFAIDGLGLEEKLNTDEFNNVAFFAYKSKAYAESIYILKKVIEKFPNRVVAYLNIADCYWATNEKEKAVENYQKYCQLMKSKKKDLKKIPKYVYERLK